MEDLKLRIAKACQAQWGQYSERQKHLIDQMELQLEDLIASATEDEVAAETAVGKAAVLGVCVERFTRRKPACRLAVGSLSPQPRRGKIAGKSIYFSG